MQKIILWDEAFRTFSDVYPHEAYASFPEEFWDYFHSKCPMINRKEMEIMLSETEKNEG
jgi:hypothetical protein